MGLSTEHLANERTYLAWIRTALALVGFGIALSKLGGKAENPEGWIRLSPAQIGIAIVAYGLLILVVAMARYWQVMTLIEKGDYSPHPRALMIMGGLAVLLGIAGLLAIV